MMLAKYGTAKTISRALYSAGDMLTSAPTIEAGDVQVSKDGGAFANVASLPTYSNGQMVVALSAAELQAGRSLIRIRDQTTAAEWDDVDVLIETYGGPSAAHPSIGVELGVEGSVDDATATETSWAAAAGLSATDDFYNGTYLVFTSGALAGLVREVVDYVGATRTVTVSPGFPSAPGDEDLFRLIGRN
jgi:hypothetical protein